MSANNHQPVPGTYYMNLTGQLIKAKMLLYMAGEPRRVLLEYLDGKHISIALAEWSWLGLSPCSAWDGTAEGDHPGLESEL